MSATSAADTNLRLIHAVAKQAEETGLVVDAATAGFETIARSRTLRNPVIVAGLSAERDWDDDAQAEWIRECNGLELLANSGSWALIVIQAGAMAGRFA